MVGKLLGLWEYLFDNDNTLQTLQLHVSGDDQYDAANIMKTACCIGSIKYFYV